MNLTFSTPAAWTEGCFGASLGFSGAMDPNEKNLRTFPCDLEGVTLTGSYAQVLEALPQGAYQAGVVLLGNCGGEDAFIRELSQRADCPLTGGAAAIHPRTGEKGLVLGRGQAAVFLITDRRYAVSVESQNIHEDILEECTVTMDSPRSFASVNGCEPVAWYTAQREKLGLCETDFEHLTLSDGLGVNAHLSIVDGRLTAGRDLEERMLLRYAHPDRVQERMRAFYDDPDALVCGCAGLKGILTAPLQTAGTGLFLFGEVCTVQGISRFGNLMLSKLCVKER